MHIFHDIVISPNKNIVITSDATDQCEILTKTSKLFKPGGWMEGKSISPFDNCNVGQQPEFCWSVSHFSDATD